MKELDVLLERFLIQGYDELESAERATFEILLEQVDQDILAWLWGRQIPSDAALATLIDRMRPIVDAGAQRSVR